MVHTARSSKPAIKVLRHLCKTNGLLHHSTDEVSGRSLGIASAFFRICAQQQQSTDLVTSAKQLVPQLTAIRQLQTQRAAGASIASRPAVLQQQSSVPGLQQQQQLIVGLLGPHAWGPPSCRPFHSCRSSFSESPASGGQGSGSGSSHQEQPVADSSSSPSAGNRSIPGQQQPIHDLHYRISRIKPTSGIAAGRSGQDIEEATHSSSCGAYAGVSPDGEADIDSSYGFQMSEDDDALSTINTDAASGGLRLRFRRRTPLFQVIEFHASGTAIEEYRERTPNELGLHPRDVTLFAPLSRLAAPQRATIAVHDGKILVKTEVVKAIITSERAILIKSRRQKDTQKIAQAILAANDQRLMAIKLWQHQNEQIKSTMTADPLGLDSCKRAASAADLLSKHTRSSQAQTAYRSSRVTYPPIYQQQQLAAGRLPPLDPGCQLQQSGVRMKPDAAGIVDDVGASGRSASPAVGRQPGTGVGASGSDLKDVPFEMLVLEVLLDATTEYFYTKVQHLNWMLESIAGDIRQPGQVQGAIDKAHQLIPIQKFLSGLKNDVKETCAAIQTALEDDETLQELCLSWHVQQRQHVAWSPIELQHHRPGNGVSQYHDSNGVAYSPAAGGAGNVTKNTAVSSEQQVRMLTEMLESYEREIQSLEGSINEAEEDLENTRSLWHMQLDTSRNHIIMVNLWLSMINISVMATTILPAVFGMNLDSGLSDSDPSIFYAVCGLSVCLSALTYPLSRYWYNRNWRKIYENELFEQKMLRVLLVQNIEDVDDIVSALRRHRHERMDRRRFREVVFEALGNRAMTPTHMDFLYRCFDRNRDGFLEEAELVRPLNTYHSSGTEEGLVSSSNSRRTSFVHSPTHYFQQQQRSGVSAPPGVPYQLGSLGGLKGRQVQPWFSNGEAVDPGRDPQGYSSTLRCPPGKQPQGQQVKTGKAHSWEDDERFNWD